MKIIGVSCSPRKEKATCHALQASLAAIKEMSPEIETVMVDLAGKTIHGCTACGACKNGLRCSQDDDFNELIPLFSDPDIAGMIIATPVYLVGMSSQCKAFLDRSVVFRRNGFMLRNCVGGAIAVGGCRNGGQELAIQSIHVVMLCHDMIVVSDGQPTSHIGATVVSQPDGSIEEDQTGLLLAKGVGRRVAEVAAIMRTRMSLIPTKLEP